MITAELHSLAADLDMLTGAIQAGQCDTAVRIAESLHEYLLGKIAEKEGPRYSSYAQNRCLAALTGWASYPPRYWQGLQMTTSEAGALISDLKGFGEGEYQGKTYYRVTTEKQEQNYRQRKALGLPDAKQRRAAKRAKQAA